MREITKRSVRKTLVLEENGQTLSVTLDLENVCPAIKGETVFPFLDTLFDKAKKELNAENFNL